MKSYSLIAFVLALGAGVAGAKEVPRATPVVKTWQQLRHVPVVGMSEFGTARVGVERPEAPRLGGVLVYALVQRDANDNVRKRFTHDDTVIGWIERD